MSSLAIGYLIMTLTHLNKKNLSSLVYEFYISEKIMGGNYYFILIIYYKQSRKVINSLVIILAFWISQICVMLRMASSVMRENVSQEWPSVMVKLTVMALITKMKTMTASLKGCLVETGDWQDILKVDYTKLMSMEQV